MSNFRVTTAIAAIMIISSAPLALAQTTLGGSAKDNSASGGKENGNAADSGKSTSGSSMMKTGSAPDASTSTENKGSATGGQSGGDAMRGK